MPSEHFFEALLAIMWAISGLSNTEKNHTVHYRALHFHRHAHGHADGHPHRYAHRHAAAYRIRSTSAGVAI